MFDDQQSNQTEHTNQDSNSTSMGIGGSQNSNYAAQSGPSDSSPTSPPVVLPSQNGGGTSSPTANTDLEDMKSRALAQLSPLVHKLDQSPEEKYKTLMMMIQASDNQDLLGEAYTAAEKITDEKAKAEALLNIVNEINYFNQKNKA